VTPLLRKHDISADIAWIACHKAFDESSRADEQAPVTPM
jgi:hypothetical protein